MMIVVHAALFCSGWLCRVLACPERKILVSSQCTRTTTCMYYCTVCICMHDARSPQCTPFQTASIKQKSTCGRAARCHFLRARPKAAKSTGGFPGPVGESARGKMLQKHARARRKQDGISWLALLCVPVICLAVRGSVSLGCGKSKCSLVDNHREHQNREGEEIRVCGHAMSRSEMPSTSRMLSSTSLSST